MIAPIGTPCDEGVIRGAAPVSQAQWVVNAYGLTLGALLLAPLSVKGATTHKRRINRLAGDQPPCWETICRVLLLRAGLLATTFRLGRVLGAVGGLEVPDHGRFMWLFTKDNQ